ncbi:MAG TPA: mannose-1-phosphate guanylyltransferase/mannose-6-phosphate isomerase [Clostridia bacterium]|nr:mannose-1-phosphate guanylyltransferase/mannose-6-phosphate isomerase [Clostridia bacterium]
MKVVALLLAGGSGTRLWPLSRQTMPKQLLALTSNKTLLQETCQRISGIVGYKDQWVITGQSYYYQILGQIKELSPEQDAAEILLEPVGKNTAPAVLWAAQRCRKLYGEDSVMMVLPSDHLIMNTAQFEKALELAVKKAEEGRLVTFGISPTCPETAYGYIEINEKSVSGRAYKVERFVEKPDAETARRFVEEGNYLWNSGMFVYHVGTLLSEAEKHCADLFNLFENHDVFDVDGVEAAYKASTSISIDYALMEHTDKAVVLVSDFGWSDVGSWKSLFDISEKDENGNVINGHHIIMNTKDSMVYSKDRLIAAIGLENIAIIDTPDALMVCPLSQTQYIRQVVEKLKQENNKTYYEHRIVERPWGTYEVLAEGPLYKMKRIVVKPKQRLSKQYHYHRSEHWIVVRGTAKVTTDGAECFVHENESTYISKSAVHQLENPGLIPLEIIEIQCGSYLGEDDIIRLEDIYNR